MFTYTYIQVCVYMYMYTDAGNPENHACMLHTHVTERRATPKSGQGTKNHFKYGIDFVLSDLTPNWLSSWDPRVYALKQVPGKHDKWLWLKPIQP